MWRSGVKLGHILPSGCLGILLGIIVLVYPLALKLLQYLLSYQYSNSFSNPWPQKIIPLPSWLWEWWEKLNELIWGWLPSYPRYPCLPSCIYVGAMPGSSSRLSTFSGITWSEKLTSASESSNLSGGLCQSQACPSLLLFCSALYGKFLAIDCIFLLVMGHIFPLLHII